MVQELIGFVPGSGAYAGGFCLRAGADQFGVGAGILAESFSFQVPGWPRGAHCGPRDGAEVLRAASLTAEDPDRAGWGPCGAVGPSGMIAGMMTNRKAHAA
ncbi:hypothetical protein ACFWTC_20770 [Streptomyces sp. NPDC058619]|uniref:hypothetical protein n=1 Tax=Streptomyces sp. NPDC058619 TaxID=3346559 RepID=UPI0036641833